jgi:large subunit ribosomal protein L6
MEKAARVKRIRLTSRIGDMPIVMPAGVTMKQEGAALTVSGPKGVLSEKVPDCIAIAQEGNIIRVTSKTQLKKDKCFHGMMRALLANMVTGVTQGFTKVLKIEGVGYRAALKGEILELSLGYSNPINYPIPKGISIEYEAKENIIRVIGFDKAAVGQVSSEIRAFRPVEPYKGKGVRYQG